jgi:hypothetical protein
MNLSDRIRRWWNPRKWRDEHPEYSAGDGFALGKEQQLRDRLSKRRQFQRTSEGSRPGKYGR